MTVTDELLASAGRYAAVFDKGDLPMPPARQIAVVACMDARLNPYGLLGLREGDAHLIRNAGGVVTEDVIRSLVISQRLLGTKEVVLIHHTDCGMLGGFNWSSQHPVRGGVDGHACGMGDGVDGARADAVSGCTVAPSGSGAGVLEADRQGVAGRGGRRGCGRVASGRSALVPPRWRHVTVRSEGVLGPVSDVCRARGDRPAKGSRRWSSRDRAGCESVAFDDQPGVASQRRHPRREARVPRVGGAVEG